MPVAVEKTREVPPITNALDESGIYLANRALEVADIRKKRSSAKVFLPFSTQVLLVVMRLTRHSTSHRVTRQILADSTQHALRQTRFKSAKVKCGRIRIHVKL